MEEEKTTMKTRHSIRWKVVLIVYVLVMSVVVTVLIGWPNFLHAIAVAKAYWGW